MYELGIDEPSFTGAASRLPVIQTHGEEVFA
jgi:hypothetical protein